MKIFKIISLLMFAVVFKLEAQNILSRNISINVDKQKLGVLLSKLEQEGGFSFSYKSDIVPTDSLVSFHGINTSVAEVLDKLLDNRFEYRQSENFIILRYAPRELKLVLQESVGDNRSYSISGQLIDVSTERPVSGASIYEKNLLVSELSDPKGYFSIRLKNITQPVSLTITKANYKSTVIHFLEEVHVRNNEQWRNESFRDGDLSGIEKTWLGNALITTKQKIQSINIGNYISSAPYQLSLTPGLSTHGSLSGQVVNRLSINAIGAYSAGVRWAELGLVFNIDKSDVQYFQFAGIFNLVGGSVHGAQIGGFFNYDLSNVKAAQASLLFNFIRKDFAGLQLTTLYNRVMGDVYGVQLTSGLNTLGKTLHGVQIGTVNFVSDDTKGIQIGIGVNRVGKQVGGVQISGIMNLNKRSKALSVAGLLNLTEELTLGAQIGAVNYTKNLKGLQIGLLNLAGRNDGYSIGLINIALNGYHKFALTTNESSQFNFAYKGGSKKFYNLLMFGANRKSAERHYTTGLGFGTEINIFRQFSLNPELSSQYVYQGSWKHLNLLYKFETAFNFRLNKWLSVQGGPSVNAYYSKQKEKIGDYGLLQERKSRFNFSKPGYSGWLGWSAGIVLL